MKLKLKQQLPSSNNDRYKQKQNKQNETEMTKVSFPVRHQIVPFKVRDKMLAKNPQIEVITRKYSRTRI